MKHVLITAPTVEPVTAANVKLHSGVIHATEDTLIDSWIASARKLAEDFQHRAYVEQTWELVLDGFPSLPVEFPRPPIISVSSVKYYDTDDTEFTYNSSNYFVDTSSEIGRLVLNYQTYWPTVILRPANSVLIRYVAGYGTDATTVPDCVKDAIYLYCSWRYDNRTGESGPVPQAFFDILQPERIAVY